MARPVHSAATSTPESSQSLVSTRRVRGDQRSHPAGLGIVVEQQGLHHEGQRQRQQSAQAPKTAVHSSREMKEATGVTPTASPVNFGWITDWITKFKTQ